MNGDIKAINHWARTLRQQKLAFATNGVGGAHAKKSEQVLVHPGVTAGQWAAKMNRVRTGV